MTGAAVPEAAAPFLQPRSHVKIGFIGLGNIGAPMARRLCAAPFDLVVFDVDRSAAQAFADLQCRIADSVAEVARHAAIVSVCVRDDAQLRNVLEGEGGLIAAAAGPSRTSSSMSMRAA